MRLLGTTHRALVIMIEHVAGTREEHGTITDELQYSTADPSLPSLLPSPRTEKPLTVMPVYLISSPVAYFPIPHFPHSRYPVSLSHFPTCNANHNILRKA